ncbi:MAG TPA: mRNA surveillance protein pelota [Candidatus Nanoarchaeia archaeon]|nr:mRNA surveillance protein pelota [Candidatus Nanoarchaeia archaeon]
MHIIHSDFKKGNVKLKITDPEDLWYLSHLIDPGDLVRGKTTRKVKIGSGENAAVAKKTYIVTIEAESLDFSPAGNSLKINGKIKEAPEEIPQGSYQSISLELEAEFILEKVHWLEFQKQKLTQAAEKKYNYLLCLFDREEALFALTKNRGHEIVLRLKGEVHQKSHPNSHPQEIKKDFYLEIIQTLDTYLKRYLPEKIILTSPAFYKEDLFRKITSPELKSKIVLATCSDVSESAIAEVIRLPELAKVLLSSRAREENLLMEELLSAINKQGLATYGWEEVKKAISAGAVSKLLLSDIFIQQQREQGNYLELDQLMKKIDGLKGEIHILSSEQESGKRLDGLGGIACLLRYKLDW